MTSKILVSIGVVVYAVIVPLLEVNASHVFSESWPPHARLHEVWQLLTNSSIGAIALWLTWSKGEARIASLLNIAVMGGVLAAYALEGSYGGSIRSGNVEITAFGIEPAAIAAGLVVVLAVVAFFLRGRLPATERN